MVSPVLQTRFLKPQAGAGVPLMRQYQDAGLQMMYEHAQFEDGGI
jgi:hypothetical protein